MLTTRLRNLAWGHAWTEPGFLLETRLPSSFIGLSRRTSCAIVSWRLRPPSPAFEFRKTEDEVRIDRLDGGCDRVRAVVFPRRRLSFYSAPCAFTMRDL